jgi:flavin-dependent dehydrogenase
MVYDVVIVGAGFNGLVAGYFLAKKGFQTLLIERGAVGDKVHGPTEFPELSMYKQDPELYNLLANVLQEVPHITNDFVMGQYYYYIDKNNNVRFKFYHGTPNPNVKDAYAVHNPTYLRKLGEKVIEAGAKIQTGTAVVDVIREGEKIKGVVTDEGEKIEGKLTIAADGRISTVALKAGLRTKWDEKDWHYQYGEAWKFKSEEEMFEATEYARYHFSGPTVTPFTYFGATLTHRPGAIVTVNIPTGVPLSYMYNNPRWYARNLYQIRDVRLMLRRCEGFPDKPLQRCSTVYPHFVAPLEKSYMNGLLVIGDAAGGCGVIVHGRVAADIAIQALEANDVSDKRLAQYQNFLNLQKKSFDIMMKTMFAIKGPGLVGETDIEEFVENMSLAGPPFILGRPNPEKIGFEALKGTLPGGFDEVVAWHVAIKLNYILELFGPLLQMPEFLPKIINWMRRNQESFKKRKVWDSPY